MAPDIISIGEPMVEFCATSKGRLSQVPLFKRGWGGDTSNFAVAVARLGGSVGYICRLGDDEFGRSFLELWKKEGVDASKVIVEKGAFTGVYFISLMEGGKHDFTYYRKDSAASHFSPEDLDESYVKEAKVLHSSGISLAVSQSLREAVLKAVSLCKASGGIFSFDPNVRLRLWPIGTARAIIEYAFRQADIILSSIEDMELLYGIVDPEVASKKLIEMGASIIALKLGAQGCYIRTRDKAFFSEGFKVDVVDTTGAGDAFDGAFLVGYLEGWDLQKISAFANAVGALTTTGFGAVAPIPTREEALRFMESRSSPREKRSF